MTKSQKSSLKSLGSSQKRNSMRDAAFQKHLASVILDNKYDRFVKNRKSGKLDTNQLYKAGFSGKVFKRREARLHKDYAFTLLVDCSGSMIFEEKITKAGEAAEKLSNHLAALGVPHNILLFHTGVIELKPFGAGKQKKIKEHVIRESKFDKQFSSRVYVFDTKNLVKSKSHPYGLYKFVTSGLRNNRRQFPKDAAKALAQYKKEHPDCEISDVTGPNFNSDAEALQIARELLLKQKGDKVLIVLSDGEPAPLHSNYESPIYAGTSQSDHNLMEQVKLTLKSGVELYSIGILSESVRSYYPVERTRVIKNSSELYKNVIELVKNNLVRG